MGALHFNSVSHTGMTLGWVRQVLALILKKNWKSHLGKERLRAG